MMKTPHLLPALFAVAVTIIGLSLGSQAASRFEDEQIHTAARQRELEPISPGVRNLFQQKSQGAALQGAAFRQNDLLVMYGGSEVITPNPFDVTTLFQNYPEGFAVFSIGKLDTTCLSILQKLASLGPNLRDQKIAISLTPISFYKREMVIPANYAGNFSPLHAHELIFSMSLSMDLKQRAAKRMIEYPKTLSGDPVLQCAVKNLARGSWLSQGIYWLTLPVGKTQSCVHRLQDHYETCAVLRGPEFVATPQRSAERMDWPSQHAKSVTASHDLANNNPYGFHNRIWNEHQHELVAGNSPLTKKDMEQMIKVTKEWTDLELLLRAIKELGGRPLILSSPIMGRYYDHWEIPADTREAYYDKLQEIAQRHGAKVITFREHDGDNDFVYDEYSHLNSKGWVHYAQALADFFHDSP